VGAGGYWGVSNTSWGCFSRGGGYFIIYEVYSHRHQVNPYGLLGVFFLRPSANFRQTSGKVVNLKNNTNNSIRPVKKEPYWLFYSFILFLYSLGEMPEYFLKAREKL
jgi:hypothetical protein